MNSTYAKLKIQLRRMLFLKNNLTFLHRIVCIVSLKIALENYI